jgi:hypothetical protein
MKGKTILLVTLLAVASVLVSSKTAYSSAPFALETGELQFSSENKVQNSNQLVTKHFLRPEWKKGTHKVVVAVKELLSKEEGGFSDLYFSRWELNMI